MAPRGSLSPATATLASALNISLLNGFTPANGNMFTVLSAASVVNNGLTLSGASAGFSLSVVGGNSLVLTFGSASVAGDYSGNGTVDAADYTLWRDTLGSTTVLTADGSGNGVIDQADYTFWRTRFGNTSSTVSAVAVPEPAACVLLTLAGLTCFASRRRRLVLTLMGLLATLLTSPAHNRADVRWRSEQFQHRQPAASRGEHVWELGERQHHRPGVR